MYEVMKALYDSGIPMNFKGSMVLKALLIEAGFPEDTRHIPWTLMLIALLFLQKYMKSKV